MKLMTFDENLVLKYLGYLSCLKSQEVNLNIEIEITKVRYMTTLIGGENVYGKPKRGGSFDQC